MTEEQEVRATHEEVEGFVSKLRDFHNSLDAPGQAMLVTILESAQGAETGAYGWRIPPYSGGGPQPWEDLIGWIESQGDEKTQGFGMRIAP
jgi:hypothetical protein